VTVPPNRSSTVRFTLATLVSRGSETLLAIRSSRDPHDEPPSEPSPVWVDRSNALKITVFPEEQTQLDADERRRRRLRQRDRHACNTAERRARTGLAMRRTRSVRRRDACRIHPIINDTNTTTGRHGRQAGLVVHTHTGTHTGTQAHQGGRSGAKVIGIPLTIEPVSGPTLFFSFDRPRPPGGPIARRHMTHAYGSHRPENVPRPPSRFYPFLLGSVRREGCREGREMRNPSSTMSCLRVLHRVVCSSITNLTCGKETQHGCRIGYPSRGGGGGGRRP
jgi:hypothetical protein